jgi:hypothetical protein
MMSASDGIANKPLDVRLVHRRAEGHRAFQPPIEEDAEREIGVLHGLVAVVLADDQRVCIAARDRRDADFFSLSHG